MLGLNNMIHDKKHLNIVIDTWLLNKIKAKADLKGEKLSTYVSNIFVESLEKGDNNV